jgi:hypothetical protein
MEGSHPRWTFHFTPTSGSWLNALETFFSALSRRRLKRGTFHSVVDLQATIHRSVAEHNADPQAVHLDQGHRSDPRQTESSECACARVPGAPTDKIDLPVTRPACRAVIDQLRGDIDAIKPQIAATDLERQRGA